jgi:hypothetical protein
MEVENVVLKTWLVTLKNNIHIGKEGGVKIDDIISSVEGQRGLLVEAVLW